MSVTISYVLISLIILSITIFSFSILYPKIKDLSSISKFEFEKDEIFLLDKTLRDIYYEGYNSTRIFNLYLYVGRLRFFNNTIIYECELGERIYEKYFESDGFRNLTIYSIRHGKGYRIMINISYNKIFFERNLELGKGMYKLLIKNVGKISVEVL